MKRTKETAHSIFLTHSTHLMPWSFSIHPENTRKSLIFLFSGGIERDQWHKMG